MQYLLDDFNLFFPLLCSTAFKVNVLNTSNTVYCPRFVLLHLVLENNVMMIASFY